MARTRSAESPRTRSKTAAIDEITQGLDMFQKILTSIEDFSREGFPYRDGARAKAELQIRETVRRLFGERSPEYQAHRAHKLKISTPAETTQSVHLVKSFITALERKKLELQGLAPAAAAPEAGQNPAASGPPQMTLVPPTTPSAQITMAQSTPGSAPPVTMSVAITTNLSKPTAPTPQTPVIEPPAPVQPPAPAIPPSHLESARFRAMPSVPEPAAPAQVSSPATSAPAITQEAIAPLAPPPSAPLQATAPPQPQVGLFSSPLASPTPAPSTPTSESQHRTPDQPSAPAASIAAPPPSPVPSPSPAPASPPVVARREQSTSDPVDALRKVCLRFHAVARQLRLRKDYRTTLEVEDDYDLQDLLCALLKLEFDEVGADEWTPPYAGGSTRTSLLLNRDRLALVVKKTRSGLTTKELAEQVAADTAHYASRKPCAHLFCFIYDPEGRIGSPTRLETDLTSVSDSFTVDVLIAPK
jgi:hypothetical protein